MTSITSRLRCEVHIFREDFLFSAIYHAGWSADRAGSRRNLQSDLFVAVLRHDNYSYFDFRSPALIKVIRCSSWGSDKFWIMTEFYGLLGLLLGIFKPLINVIINIYLNIHSYLFLVGLVVHTSILIVKINMSTMVS